MIVFRGKVMTESSEEISFSCDLIIIKFIHNVKKKHSKMLF